MKKVYNTVFKKLGTNKQAYKPYNLSNASTGKLMTTGRHQHLRVVTNIKLMECELLNIRLDLPSSMNSS